MTVSIIVPVFNSLPDLLSLINTLSFTVDWQTTEIILVDDSSPEFKCNELFGPPLKVLRNETNLGFSGTCNRGAELAQGDILVFLNSDILCAKNWLEPIVKLFEKPEVGIVGPKLIFPAQPEKPLQIQSCGGLYDVTKSPFHRYIGWSVDDWRVNQTEKVSWTTGAALAIRRADFFAVQGFDTRFIRGYFEDCALAEAVKNNLHKEIWYCPDSVLIHAVGKSTTVKTDEENREMAKLFRHNSNLFHELWDAKIVPDCNIKMVPF